MERLRLFLAEQDMGRLARACYQCSVCAGGCPVAQWRDDFNPRRFLEQILRHDLEAALDDDRVWLCAGCHTCLERCPQRIEVSEIMVQLKNAAARRGRIPDHERKAASELIKTGWVQSPGSRTLRIRRELQLPEPPAGIAAQELARLCDCLRLRDRIETSPPGADAAPEEG